MNKDYDLIAKEFSDTRSKPWPETIFLFDYITKNSKVLDLGCGNGRYYETVKNKKAKYFGLDASKELIKIAKEKHPKAKFITGNALDTSFKNNFFDFVYSIAVLHHMSSKELRLQFLKEAERILKPSGKMIITVWKSNIKKEKNTMEPWSNKVLRYYHWFSKKELDSLVEESGFEIEEIGDIKNERGNRNNIYVVAKKRP